MPLLSPQAIGNAIGLSVTGFVRVGLPIASLGVSLSTVSEIGRRTLAVTVSSLGFPKFEDRVNEIQEFLGIDNKSLRKEETSRLMLRLVKTAILTAALWDLSALLFGKAPSIYNNVLKITSHPLRIETDKTYLESLKEVYFTLKEVVKDNAPGIISN